MDACCVGCKVIVGEGWVGKLVNVTVGGKDVDVAVGIPTVGVGEAGKEVLVGWIVDGINVAVACGLAGNNVFVGAIVGGVEVAVA